MRGGWLFLQNVVMIGALLASGRVAVEPIAIAPPPRTTQVDFNREVLPILRANCAACHSATKAESGLVMDSPQTLLKGGEQGPAIVAGKGDESLLLKVASHRQESYMPPKDNTVGAKDLTPTELGLLKLWIDQGAHGSAGERKIAWQTPAARYAPVLAADVSRDGLFVAASRGNQVSVYRAASGELAAKLADGNLGGATHRDMVRALAFDKSGTLLATGGFREVKLWRRAGIVAGGEYLHGARATATAVSADGKLAAVGDERGGLTLVDVATREKRWTMDVHAGEVTAIVVSADGSHLYSVGADKRLKAWKAADGAAVGTAIELTAPVTGLALVAAGQQLVTAAEDGTLQYWSADPDAFAAAAEKKPLKEAKAHEGKISALIAVADGKELWSAGADGRAVRWNAATGEKISEVRAGGAIEQLSLSDDGKRLAIVGAGRVWLADATKEGEPQELRDPQMVAKLASLEGDLFITKSSIEHAGRDIKSYEGSERRVMTTAEEVRKGEETRDKAIKTRDEKKAALEKAKADKKDEKAVKSAENTLAEAETAVLVAGTIIDRAKAVAERAVQTFAEAKADVAAREARLKELEAEKGKLGENAGGQQANALAAAFSGDGKTLLLVTTQGHLHLIDLASGRSVAEAEGAAAVKRLFPGGSALAIASDGQQRLQFWKSSNEWELVRTIGSENDPSIISDRVLALDFSPDGQTVAVGSGVASQGGEVKLFAVSDGQKQRELSPVPADCVLAVKYSPDGGSLAVAGADRVVSMWEVASGALKQSLAGHTAHVLSLSWKADGKILASASTDHSIKLWDVEKGALQQTLKGDTYQIGAYKGEITSVAFVGASEQILAASGDGTVRLHRTTSENDILTFGGSQGYQNCVAATPDGDVLVAGGADGKLRIWSRHEREPKMVIAP